MDFQQFKKDLLEEMRVTLKPHGFAKYGHRFRYARENGVACMVEVYGHRCGGTLMINVYFGVLPAPVTAESWKNWEIKTGGCLGQSLEDGWSNHHWIEPYDEDDPRVVDGFITCRSKQNGGPWQERKVPAPTPRQATAEVCGLLQNKLLRFESLPNSPAVEKNVQIRSACTDYIAGSYSRSITFQRKEK